MCVRITANATATAAVANVTLSITLNMAPRQLVNGAASVEKTHYRAANIQFFLAILRNIFRILHCVTYLNPLLTFLLLWGKNKCKYVNL